MTRLVVLLIFMTVECRVLAGIPIGVRRPTFAFVALRGGPLFHAAGTDAAGVEGMPFVAAGAAPNLVAGRLPLAEGATDARAGYAGTDAASLVCDDLAHAPLIQESARKFRI